VGLAARGIGRQSLWRPGGIAAIEVDGQPRGLFAKKNTNGSLAITRYGEVGLVVRGVDGQRPLTGVVAARV
jgi:hypothetical protein